MELVIPSEVQLDSPGGPLTPDIGTHDWAPDGTRVVYSKRDEGLFVEDLADPLTGGELLVADSFPGSPVWSADDRIAFESWDNGFNRVEAIHTDGSGRKTLAKIKWSAEGVSYVGKPAWSPDASHLIYFRQRERGGKITSEIGRVTADGKDDVTLAEYGRPVAWR